VIYDYAKGTRRPSRRHFRTGASTPWANDAFPLFKISSPISKTFSDSVENFSFSTTFFDFQPSKFLMTFFIHWLQILNFPPIFAVSVHFSLFRENYYFPPTFANFPPDFVKFTCFFTYFKCFRFPAVWPWCIYESHNARTGPSGRPCFRIPSLN